MSGFLKAKQRVGGYEIDAIVGKGGMGEVYRARQISMDRVVALKVLAARLARQDASFAKRFVDEARAAGRLNHPNIIAVHDVGKAPIPAHDGDGEEDAYYFSMELVDGETIKAVVQREGACAKELIDRVMLAMADALVYAEQMGVVHRDIKPDNIMVTDHGQVKLADLGLAQQIGDAGESVDSDKDEQGRTRVMGTPMFMSPEQARGLPVDHRSDQYSLGATLYNMLTGRAPFIGDNSKAIMRAHVFDQVPDPRDHGDVPEAWRRLCMRMMAKEPAQRYADAEQLRAAVKAAVESPGSAGPSRRMRPSGKPVKYETRPTTERATDRVDGDAFMPGWVKVVLALAVLVAIGLLMLLSSDDEPKPTTASPLAEPRSSQDDLGARVRAALESLPGDPEVALETLGKLIGQAKGDDAFRTALTRERDQRAARLDEQRRPAREAQERRLNQADEEIRQGHLQEAREALAALAKEQPSYVAQRIGEVQGRLAAAVRQRADALIADAASAANEDGLALILAKANTGLLDPAAAAEVQQAVQRQRTALAAKPVAAPDKPKVDAKALWREAYAEFNARRGAVPANYSGFSEIAERLGAKADADATLAQQVRSLGELGSLLEKADHFLRNQLRSTKPKVSVRANGKATPMKVEDVDAENVFITTSAGKQPRPRANAIALEDELDKNLNGLPLDQRAAARRCYAAFCWYWAPDKAARALAELPAGDALAKALAALEQNGRLLDVRAPTTQEGGTLSVAYDFTSKDDALLADFEGDGATWGEHGLHWLGDKVLSGEIKEKDIQGYRWRGRLTPPLKLTAEGIVRQANMAMIGLFVGDHAVRAGYSTASGQLLKADLELLQTSGDAPAQVAQNPKATMAIGKFTFAMEVDAERRVTIAVNGKALATPSPLILPEGAITIGLQGLQTNIHKLKTSRIELLSLSITGRPAE